MATSPAESVQPPGELRAVHEPPAADDLFADVFSRTAEGLAIVRLPDGMILEVNDAFLRLAGLPRHHLVGADSFASGLWADLGDATAARRTLQNRTWIDDLLATLVTPAGTVSTMRVSAETLRAGDHGEILVLVRATSSAEFAHAVDRFRVMQEVEARYRSLVEQLPAIIYIEVQDPSSPTRFRDVYTSPQADAMLGYTSEEWSADPELWRKVTHPDDIEMVMAEEEATSTSGRPFSCTYRVIAKSGAVLWFRDEAVFVRDPISGVHVWKGVMLDVTDQKVAEERLRRLDALKNTLLHSLSHDLKGPLTAIGTAAATLERLGDALSKEERLDLIRTMALRAHRMDDLLSDLLDLERLDRGIVEPRRATVNLGDLIRTVMDETNHLDDRPVEIQSGEVLVQADRAKVERIVENLIANVARHTPRGSAVHIEAAREADGAMLVVADHGPGVPDELKEVVFEEFRRGPGAESQGGSGIGLSLVARFAQLHGGRAWVEDRAGGGAAFHVFIPDDEASAGEASA